MEFDNIKQSHIEPDILAFSMNGGQFVLDTDASSDKIGVIIYQAQNEVERVIVMEEGPLASQKVIIVQYTNSCFLWST